MTSALTVPVADLVYETPAPGVAALEKPISVRFGPVAFADGTVIDADRLSGAGFVVIRRSGTRVLDAWDDGAAAWRPLASVVPRDLQPAPVLFRAGQAVPWEGVLIAAGQKDAAGAPRFASATAGSPDYHVRGWFATGDDAFGWGPPSAAIRFVSIAELALGGVALGESETAQNATQVRVFLRRPGQQDGASVTMRRSGNDVEVELRVVNDAGSPARIRIEPTGDITLEPAANRKVLIRGEVETGRLSCRDAAGNLVSLP